MSAEKEKRQQAKMDDFDPNESISQFLAQFKEEQEAITVEITKMTQSGPASGAAGVQNK